MLVVLYVTAALNIAGLVWYIAMGFHFCGAYRRGYDSGYERGRKDCEKWVIDLDASVQREQEKIWKEGL